MNPRSTTAAPRTGLKPNIIRSFYTVEWRAGRKRALTPHKPDRIRRVYSELDGVEWVAERDFYAPSALDHFVQHLRLDDFNPVIRQHTVSRYRSDVANQ